MNMGGQHDSGRPRTVAIVGGGASGALTAVALTRLADRSDRAIRVQLFDPTTRPGRGLAYGTTDLRHLLNVRAGRMSAFPDEPDDFVRWAESAGIDVHRDTFLPRRYYGDYLAGLVDEAVRTGVLEVRRGWVRAVRRTEHGFVLQTTDGAARADAVVLAYGNLPPATPGSTATRCDLVNAWESDAIERLPDDGRLLLVGTGLTAVDAALTVLGDHPQRRAIAVSRHGLLPRSHQSGPEGVWSTPIPAAGEPLTVAGLRALLHREVAAAARAGVDWRAVMNGLRPVTQGIWIRLSEDERRIFLATAAREWEVHRHRTAPAVTETLDRLMADGRLTIRRAALVGAKPDPPGYRTLLEAPDGTRDELRVAAILNCTGPRTDVTGSDDPLLASMLTDGLIRPDPLHLGLDTDDLGALVDRDGDSDPRLITVGPPRRGGLWECNAVPEIRDLAAQAARHLLAELDVEPEALADDRAVAGAARH
jgi:uncharacterized NAD(P)/FAD-binding protein YdhS